MDAEPEKVIATGTFALNDQDTFIINHEDGKSNETIHYRDVIVALPAPTKDSSAGLEYDILAAQTSGQEDANGTKESSETHYVLKSTRAKKCPDTFLNKYALSVLPRHLSDCRGSTTNTELQIIVSTKSGICEAKSYYRDIVQGVLSRLGFLESDYKVHYTASDRWITEFASRDICSRASAGVSQTILLLSGDGGVIDIINALFGSSQSDRFVKPIIGLLVLGTGNALANSSGLNNDSTKGLSTFLRGTPRNVPTLVTKLSPGSVLLVDEARKTEFLDMEEEGVGVVHGAVVTSWGLHAALVADSDTTEYRKFGRERFSMAANELLDPSDGSQSHTYRGRITMFKLDKDGTEHSTILQRQDHMYMLATLVSNLEAALKISPQSKPLDGQLRVVHFGPLPSASVKRIFGLAFGGGMHVHEEAVSYETVEGLRIDFEEPDARWRRICVDGKIIRVGEGGWVEVRKGSRDVLDLVI